MELTVNRNIIVFLCFLPVCWSHSSSCKVLRLVNTTYHHHFPSLYTKVEGVMCNGRNVYHNMNYYMWHQSAHMNWYIGEQSGADVQCDYTRGSISSVFGATGQFPEDSSSWFERSDEHANFDPTDAMVICDEDFLIEVPLSTLSPTITTDVITPTGPTNLTGKEFSIEVPLTTSSPTITTDVISPTGPTNLSGSCSRIKVSGAKHQTAYNGIYIKTEDQCRGGDTYRQQRGDGLLVKEVHGGGWVVVSNPNLATCPSSNYKLYNLDTKDILLLDIDLWAEYVDRKSMLNGKLLVECDVRDTFNSFICQGPELWSKLSEDIKSARSVAAFRRQIKSYQLSTY